MSESATKPKETLHRVEMTCFLENLSEKEADAFCNRLADWLSQPAVGFSTMSVGPADPETGHAVTSGGGITRHVKLEPPR